MRNSFEIFNSIVNTLIAIGTIGATLTALWLSHEQSERLTNDTLKVSFGFAEMDIKSGSLVPNDGTITFPAIREGHYLSIHLDNVGYVNGYITSIFLTRQCQDMKGYARTRSINVDDIKVENIHIKNINPRERFTVYVEIDKIRSEFGFCSAQNESCMTNIDVQTVLHGYSFIIPDDVVYGHY